MFSKRMSIQLMPMETLDVAIISTLPIDGLICTDAEFIRRVSLDIIERTANAIVDLESLKAINA